MKGDEEMKCELLDTCIFFNEKMKNMPSTTQIFKKTYCLSDNKNCARYVVYKALGRENIPTDLFPGDLKRAESIVKEK